MYLTALRLDGFRNIKNQEIFPCGGVNVIFGNNAQGKTNLIEAIFFCSGLGSFRGAKEAELIPFGQDFLSLSADFFQRDETEKRKSKFQGKKRKFCCQEFRKSGFPPFAGNSAAWFFSRRPFSHKKRSRKQKKIFGHGSLHAKAGLPKAAFKL